MKLAIGSDHRGFALKEELKSFLKGIGVEIFDAGPLSDESVDYPDYGGAVARKVSQRSYDRGILICHSGLGMSIVANKFPRVRAALCHDAEAARLSREHNDANVLVLGGGTVSGEQAIEIVRTWLNTQFQGERHERRIRKIGLIEQSSLLHVDPESFELIHSEAERQTSTLTLIASENYATPAVLEAQGSLLTNKYAEGYPGKRYYGGCAVMDRVEELAASRARELFGAEHANVQPHSGSQANMAVYLAALKPGETIMGMELSHGGHLSHGSSVNFSGQLFRAIPYGVQRDTGRLDYGALRDAAKKHRPQLIVAGSSAYPRIIEFKKFSEICQEVDCLLLADIAHVAGLVAAGLHPSPVPYADFITATTHKTLRGPRGGFILCKKAWAKKVDSQVFPGTQGGPLMHVIAAKAVAFREALSPQFQESQRQVLSNAKTLGDALKSDGFSLVTGGTDNHLLLIDLSGIGLTGKEAEEVLDKVGITVNKNTIPYDPKGPAVTSGIRIGCHAVTSRGMREAEMKAIAKLISQALSHREDEAFRKRLREEVLHLCQRFPTNPPL